ncbi:MAG: relaxase domain-containing protein [Actinobacteria bacterium]|nr:relaxase domain-containing protein [Actinomycetota bacterium]MCL6104809.1 relaxase domain-containing protein [Actinomycetota bacterium]
MLNISKVAKGGQDYYLMTVPQGAKDGIEPDGRWIGATSGELGLEGQIVEKDVLQSVLEGVDPTRGELLARAHNRVKIAGFDLTFCAPKSVSLLLALGQISQGQDSQANSLSIAKECMNSHWQAVTCALGYLERQAVWVRRQENQARHMMSATGVVAAGFSHRINRALDPHLHTHVLVANLAHSPKDQGWSALAAKGLYRHAYSAGYLYQAHLRWEMSRRLGVSWGPVRSGCADLTLFDRKVIEAFSTRQAQIKKHLDEVGFSSRKASRVAALVTRAAKNPDIGFDQLLPVWQAKAESLGVDFDTRTLFRPGRSSTLINSPDFINQLIKNFKQESFGRRELIRACSGMLADGAPVYAIERLVDRALCSDLVRCLEVRKTNKAGISFCSSPAFEQRWMTNATKIEIGMSAALGASFGFQERNEAVEKLPSMRESAMTTLEMLDATRKKWERSGKVVVGISSDANELHRLETLAGVRGIGVVSADANERLLLNEAMSAIAKKRSLASQQDKQLLLVIDAKNKISASGLDRLVEFTRQGGVEVVHADSLNAMDIRTAMDPTGRDELNKNDYIVGEIQGMTVTVGSSLDQVRQLIASEWRDAVSKGERVLIVAFTNRDQEVLEQLCATPSELGGRLKVDKFNPEIAKQAVCHPSRLADLLQADFVKGQNSRLLVLGDSVLLKPFVAAEHKDYRTSFYAVAGLAPVTRLPALLGKIAEVAHPGNVVSLLGERPSRAMSRLAWDNGAMEIMSYNERWVERCKVSETRQGRDMEGDRAPRDNMAANGRTDQGFEQRLDKLRLERTLKESRIWIKPVHELVRSNEFGIQVTKGLSKEISRGV